MSSDLYWDNLGVDARDQFRQDVVRNAYEMVNYLKKAERRLSYRNYFFKFTIQQIVVVPRDKKGLEKLRKADGIYFDAELGRAVSRGSILNAERMQVQIPSPLVDWHLFARVGGSPEEVKVRSEVTLSDLEPVDVSEDEEDFALDLLYEQSEFVYNPGSTNVAGRMKIIYKRRNDRLVTLNAMPEGSRIMATHNTYVIRREFEALEALALRPKPHHLPLLNLLQKTRYARWGEVESDHGFQYKILTDAREGTGDQRLFVQKALGTPDLAMLEGPPGSGKTTTILEIILQLIPKRKRVLLVASTHVAVDNVIEKLIETSVEGMTLIERFGVVPLRIGETDDISQKVLRYHIDSFVETERERLLRFLGRIPSRTEPQNILYESLCDDDRGKAVLENMALASANLICGTTIGVLRSRFIRESKESKPAFDYLILDEASKTTFQEFLVPALHAARWILSGDPKQLSPYVDQVPIRENLANLPTLDDETGTEDKRICVDVFRAVDKRSGPGYGRLVVYPDDSDMPRRYREQAEAVQGILAPVGSRSKTVPIYAVTDARMTATDRLHLSGSNTILVPESLLPVVEDSLPPTLPVNKLSSDTFKRRRKAYLTYLSRKGISTSTDQRKMWEDEIAWRLSRLHELKDVKEKQDDVILDLDLLIPHFEKTSLQDRQRPEAASNSNQKISGPPRDELIVREVQKIERIALPSVLELLQQGYKKSGDLEEGAQIPLYDGLPGAVFKERHTLLGYQHRMHPQISSFPRKCIYLEGALKDSPEIAKIRDWSYNLYSSRSVWVNVSPGRGQRQSRDPKSNFNREEVEVVSNHLKRFMKWSRQNPSQEKGSDGYWSVALLSFYKGQENKLCEAMRTLFNSKSWKYFESRADNVKVEVCVVDRFQGHEADLVFLSLVNNHNKIGFLDNPNRLNVALTRAKYQMVIIGDRKTFRESAHSTDLLRSLEETTPEGPIGFGEA